MAPTIKCCLFDMDGLLLDTEAVYSKVTQGILSRFGKNFEWSVKSKMIGVQEQEAAKILIDHYQIPMTVEEYLKERNAGHESLFPLCRPLPGVMKLVTYLKSKKIPIAVATSSHRRAFNLKSSQNGELFSLFDAIVCADDHAAIKSKPAPDIFLAAAKAVGFEGRESECLVFEDAPSGVKAGLNAGMHVVWVPDANLTKDEELVRRCAAVLSSLQSCRFCFVSFDQKQFFVQMQ
ncbi:HAD-like domain-containing protein [Zopfochytrium polystomum]|nr:HAD-like domain-containing protein [Zopfochytrium polystomum]